MGAHDTVIVAVLCHLPGAKLVGDAIVRRGRTSSGSIRRWMTRSPLCDTRSVATTAEPRPAVR